MSGKELAFCFMGYQHEKLSMKPFSVLWGNQHISTYEDKCYHDIQVTTYSTRVVGMLHHVASTEVYQALSELIQMGYFTFIHGLKPYPPSLMKDDGVRIEKR